MPDRKNVVRPDVAYVMDDILKDVINRGTAAQARAGAFRNNPGKTAFAGKTRNFAPMAGLPVLRRSLVCVVYVGFDNGDDLGMKGADSAMPVWADCMQKALRAPPRAGMATGRCPPTYARPRSTSATAPRSADRRACRGQPDADTGAFTNRLPDREEYYACAAA